MKHDTVILAAKGFPWLAAVAWTVVAAAGTVLGMQLFQGSALGGNFTVSALVANGVFAAMLGRSG